MNPKKKFAEEIAKHLDKEQKEEMVKKFKEKHKDNPMLDELVGNLKKMLYGDTDGDKT